MDINLQATFYSGTSGLVLPVPNKSYFPTEFQDKSRLTYYASLFNSLEINSSFYKIPLTKTVEKWVNETPDDFRFTYKLWQGITHNKNLQFNIADVNRFMGIITSAGKKSGCLLIQLPPSSTVLLVKQLIKLLAAVQQANMKQWKIAVEFRDKSWYQTKTYHLLAEQNVTIVLHDMPKSGISRVETDTDFIYLRFHGVNGDYKGGYTDDFLREYADYIKIWLQAGKTVYTYFNNTIGDAVKNLQTLNGFVSK